MNKLRQWVSGIAREIAKEEINNIRPAVVLVQIPVFNDKGEPGWRSRPYNTYGMSQPTTPEHYFYGERPTSSGFSFYERAYKEYPLQEVINELNKGEKIRWVIPTCQPAHIQVKK